MKDLKVHERVSLLCPPKIFFAMMCFREICLNFSVIIIRTFSESILAIRYDLATTVGHFVIILFLTVCKANNSVISNIVPNIHKSLQLLKMKSDDEAHQITPQYQLEKSKYLHSMHINVTFIPQ